MRDRDPASRLGIVAGCGRLPCEAARVLREAGGRVAALAFEGLTDQMVGPLMYGISSDPVNVAKVLNDFAKGNEHFTIKAAAMPNAVISAKEVEALANMPSRAQLVATLMATMQAPVAKFVRTLNEVPTGFVRALAAVKEQKEQAGA